MMGEEGDARIMKRDKEIERMTFNIALCIVQHCSSHQQLSARQLGSFAGPYPTSAFGFNEELVSSDRSLALPHTKSNQETFMQKRKKFSKTARQLAQRSRKQAETQSASGSALCVFHDRLLQANRSGYYPVPP
jgi:hypothetical protein